MVKPLFAVALLALGLGFAVVSDSRAQLMAPPQDAAPVSDLTVGARVCPVNILCVRGRVARCHYSSAQHRCVCRCVRRGY